MKIVYICHPISGDVENNIDKLLDIIRKINLEEPDIMPFAPYIVSCLTLEDHIPSERARGIKNNIEFFNRKIIDEVRVYDKIVSARMAHELKIPVTYII